LKRREQEGETPDQSRREINSVNSANTTGSQAFSCWMLQTKEKEGKGREKQ